MTRYQVGALIRDARERADLKQDELAQRVGCSGSYITMLEKGRSLPSPEMAVKLERALSLKSGLLLKRALALRMDGATSGAVSRALGVREHEPSVRVPLVGTCPADAGSIAPDEIEEWVEFPARIIRGRRMYVLRVNGDHLRHAGLEDGDLVLVDAEAPPRNGDLVVVSSPEEPGIQKFFRTEQRITLRASQEDGHKRLTFSRMADVPVRGVVEAIYLKRLR